MIENVKSEKGISIITLGVMIVILLIISQVAIYNSRNAIKLKKIEELKNDIEILDTKVAEYYSKKQILPLGPRYTNTSMITSNPDVLNPNDDIYEYYIIDLKKLENLSLNNGRDFDKILEDRNLEDIYIINKESHTIYYPKGVEIEGKKYYRNDTDYSKIDIQQNSSTSIKIEQTYKGWTNSDVVLRITFGAKLTDRKIKYTELNEQTNQSELKEEILPVEYEKVINISENQVVIANAKDKSGKIVEKKLKISNIDKVAPTGEIVLETTDWVNRDLQAKLIMQDEASGINMYQFTTKEKVDENSEDWKVLDENKQYVSESATISENGNYYLHIVDMASNLTTIKIEVKNIDKKQPVLNLVTLDNITGKDKKLSATGLDGESGIRYYYLGKEKQGDNINWTDLLEAKQFITYTESAKINEKWYFYAKDIAGNIASTEIDIGT